MKWFVVMPYMSDIGHSKPHVRVGVVQAPGPDEALSAAGKFLEQDGDVPCAEFALCFRVNSDASTPKKYRRFPRLDQATSLPFVPQ